MRQGAAEELDVTFDIETSPVERAFHEIPQDQATFAALSPKPRCAMPLFSACRLDRQILLKKAQPVIPPPHLVADHHDGNAEHTAALG